MRNWEENLVSLGIAMMIVAGALLFYGHANEGKVCRETPQAEWTDEQKTVCPEHLD